MPVAGVLLLAFIVAVAPAGGQGGRQALRDRVAVEVGDSTTKRGGLLETLLLPVEERDLVAAENGLVSHLQGKPWIEVVRADGEAAVAITRCLRRQASRRLSKDGKTVNIEFKYLVTAAVAIGRERDTLDAEVSAARSYNVSASRQEPSESQDRSSFEQAGGQLGPAVSAWILARMPALRPDGPDAGFKHEVKHRWLVRGDGLEVTAVASGSPAERAGLRVGDRIRRVDEEDGTSEMDEKVRTWRFLEAGTKVQIEVERNRERQKMELVLAPHVEKKSRPPEGPASAESRKPKAT